MLKDDEVREPAKQKEVEKILGPVPSDQFNKLVNLGKAINDFVTDGAGGEAVRYSRCLSLACGITALILIASRIPLV